jgi:hypothetical protein
VLDDQVRTISWKRTMSSAIVADGGTSSGNPIMESE